MITRWLSMYPSVGMTPVILLLVTVLAGLAISTKHYVLSARLASIGVVFALVWSAMVMAVGEPLPLASVIHMHFSMDRFAQLYHSVILLVGMVCMLGIGRVSDVQEAKRSYLTFAVLMLIVSALLLVSAISIVSLFFSFEMMAFSFWLIQWNDPQLSGSSTVNPSDNTHHQGQGTTGYDYTVVVSLVVLFGLAVLFTATGGLNYQHIYQALFYDLDNKLILLGGIILCIGFAAKLGLAPLHATYKQVNAQPQSISFLSYAGIMLVAMSVALVRLLTQMSLAAIEVIEVVIGVFALLAAIHHVYLLLSEKTSHVLHHLAILHVAFVCITILALGEKSALVTNTLLVSYAVAISAVCLTLWLSQAADKSVVEKAELEDKNTELAQQNQKVKSTNYLLHIACAVGLGSLIGLPFLVGFYAKYMLLFASVQGLSFYLVVATIVIYTFASFAVIRLVYRYYRDINAHDHIGMHKIISRGGLYLLNTHDSLKPVKQDEAKQGSVKRGLLWFVLCALLVFIVVFGLFPELFLYIMKHAVINLT